MPIQSDSTASKEVIKVYVRNQGKKEECEKIHEGQSEFDFSS